MKAELLAQELGVDMDVGRAQELRDVEMSRGRSTGVFAVNLGLGDPEQQGNTCTCR